MVDLPDLSAAAGASALLCDRAIFTSLPSVIGEGYRLVAWSDGLRAEERVELTRRAPSHGALCGDAGSSRGLILLRLQSSARVACGFVRVAGAEHTRRGGGRVWTDFLVAGAAEAGREGLHPRELCAALAAEPAPKPPLGSAALARVGVAPSGAGSPAARDARAVAMAAVAASLLVEGRACVVAAGSAPVDVFEDALRMIPASLRGGIEASAGLRFSPVRGVKVTLTDSIDRDTVRATRGQGVDCIDVEARPPAVVGALAPRLRLMSRWWNENRGGEAVELADKLCGGWSVKEILEVASLCEAIDRREQSPEALDELLKRRAAA